MPRQVPILIGCPQYRVLVRGHYDCDASGQPPLNVDGGFILAHAHCRQREGRCMQTRCVLHRYNRRGKGSWYPTTILAADTPASTAANASGGSRDNRSHQKDLQRGWLA